MVGPIPMNANEFIEQQLDERAEAVEQQTESDTIALIGPILLGVDDIIRNIVERKRQSAPNRNRLTVILTTRGGYIEVVQRIVETMRHHYDYVDFVIPNYAFSAGTVLVMSGDAIYMDYYSRLGPIDPQVEVRGGGSVPALGYLIQYERLLEKAKKGDITTAETQLLIDGFDQAELYVYEQARELSVSLLREWLVKYKFKNWKTTETRKKPVTEEMRAERAEDIARELNRTDRWHTHGRGISMEILQQDLRLKIDDFGANPPLNDCIKQYYNLLSDYVIRRGNTGVMHTVGTYLPFA